MPITEIQVNMHQQFHQILPIQQIYEVFQQSMDETMLYYLLKITCEYYTELYGVMKEKMNCLAQFKKLIKLAAIQTEYLIPEHKSRKLFLYDEKTGY